MENTNEDYSDISQTVILELQELFDQTTNIPKEEVENLLILAFSKINQML